MRVTFLAPLTVLLLACQQPGAPEADEMLDQASPSSAMTQGRVIVEADGEIIEGLPEEGHPPSESEEHPGC
jgi:hypothetical protein